MHDGIELRDALVEGHALVHVLAQVGLDLRPAIDRRIDARIGAPLVGTDCDQIAVVFIERRALAQPSRQRELRGRHHLVHDAAHG